jgi:hypothetical protein
MPDGVRRVRYPFAMNPAMGCITRFQPQASVWNGCEALGGSIIQRQDKEFEEVDADDGEH